VTTIEQAIENTRDLLRFCAGSDLGSWLALYVAAISAYRAESKCCAAGAYASYLAEAAARTVFAGEAS
jgi:hypothetical protein